MEVLERVANKDLRITAQNGDCIVIKKGASYTTAMEPVLGRVLVFAKFWVHLDEGVFCAQWGMDHFRGVVQDFCVGYLSAAVKNYTIEYADPKDGYSFRAEITATTDSQMSDSQWHVTITTHPERHEDIAIMVADDHYLEADDAGLFACLWEQAVNRIRELLLAKPAEQAES